jgi:hypothetical protein
MRPRATSPSSGGALTADNPDRDSAVEIGLIRADLEDMQEDL